MKLFPNISLSIHLSLLTACEIPATCKKGTDIVPQRVLFYGQGNIAHGLVAKQIGFWHKNSNLFQTYPRKLKRKREYFIGLVRFCPILFAIGLWVLFWYLLFFSVSYYYQKVAGNHRILCWAKMHSLAGNINTWPVAVRVYTRLLKWLLKLIYFPLHQVQNCVVVRAEAKHCTLSKNFSDTTRLASGS